MYVGLDALIKDTRTLARLRTERIGFLGHPASVTRTLTHAIDALRQLEIYPTVLFGPEHGFDGESQDMISVHNAREVNSACRVISLYGDSFERLSPQPDELAEMDCLIIDLQDIGTRFYTFTWTALLALRACAQANVRVLLLDRPNPINGIQREGHAFIDPSLISFVGLAPIPIRHAQTLGEIIQACAQRENLQDALEIINVEGWQRAHYGDEWDRPFVITSPNMPTVDTAIVYPGGCLVEATNLSEGRGTTKPFEMIGAPWLNASMLARSLNESGLLGFIARPVRFLPMFHKHRGQTCHGVYIHVTHRNRFQPVATYLALLTFARAQNTERFALRTEPYEFVDASYAPALDLLCGTDTTRKALMSGAMWQEVVATIS